MRAAGRWSARRRSRLTLTPETGAAIGWRECAMLLSRCRSTTKVNTTAGHLSIRQPAHPANGPGYRTILAPAARRHGQLTLVVVGMQPILQIRAVLDSRGAPARSLIIRPAKRLRCSPRPPPAASECDAGS